MTTLDISPWLQLLIAVASASVPVFLTIIGTWAKAHFKLAANSNAANIIDLMVTAGTQTAQAALARAPDSAKINVKNAAVASYLSTISDGAQAAMKLKGVTAADIATRIDGALASALTPPAAALTPTPKAP